jgi:hypothetical protein
MIENIDINKVFLPSRAIRGEHQEQFVGRNDTIRKGIVGLHNDGACLAIIGARGIGKTSLGWQILEILSGNTNLLTRNNIHIPVRLENHHCAWVECTKRLQTVEGLIVKLLSQPNRNEETSDVGLAAFSRDALLAHQADQRLRELIGDYGIQALSGQSGSNIQAGTEVERILNSLTDEKKQSLYYLFELVVNEVADKTKKKLVIFIDEFDKLPNREGLGDLFKSGGNVQFVVIGIADNLNDIIKDHLSSERKFLNSTINLDRFLDAEVDSLFDRAETLLAEHHIRFSKNFRQQVTAYSDGFPYLVQALGNSGLIQKLSDGDLGDANEIVIKGSDFDKALQEILRPEIDTDQRYDRLSRRINTSGKESILFFLADQGGWVDEQDLINGLESKYRFLSNILELQDDGIIKIINDRIRFVDPIMRAIVKYKKAKQEKLYEKKPTKESFLMRKERISEDFSP